MIMETTFLIVEEEMNNFFQLLSVHLCVSIGVRWFYISWERSCPATNPFQSPREVQGPSPTSLFFCPLSFLSKPSLPKSSTLQFYATLFSLSILFPTTCILSTGGHHCLFTSTLMQLYSLILFPIFSSFIFPLTSVFCSPLLIQMQPLSSSSSSVSHDHKRTKTGLVAFPVSPLALPSILTLGFFTTLYPSLFLLSKILNLCSHSHPFTLGGCLPTRLVIPMCL